MKVFNEKDNVKRMILFLFLIFVLIFIGLGIKVGYIVFNNNLTYEKKVIAQQIKKKTYSSIIEPKRGAIKDRNGIVLAESIKLYNVVYDCKYINSFSYDEIDKVNEFLSMNIEDITIKDLEEKLELYPESQYQLLQKNMNYNEVEYIIEALESGEISGVALEGRYTRVYPYNTLASDVIGFTNVFEGLYGIEKEYEDLLKGENGRLMGVIDEDTKVKQDEIPAVNGMDIELTIDFTIQKYVEETIKGFYDEHDIKSINAITMDPNTGEILAMASYPNYNLNEPFDVDSLFDSTYLEDFTEDEKLDLRYDLWNNFLVNTTYEPGSTYKPFVLAAALEEGIVELDDEYYCPSYKVVYDYVIHCWKDFPGHEELTAKEGLANSCNVVFMDIAEEMGKEIYYEYHNSFGFGDKTDVDMLGEEKGIMYTYDQINPVELATCSFGQGFNITPIQLITGFSALVNGGNLYTPYIMKNVQDESGHIIDKNSSTLVRQVISEETSAEISYALYESVEDGTGYRGEIIGYEVGGKTGTAEKGERGEEKYITSFIGAAPIYNPQLITLVVVDEPGEDEVESYYAAEVFSEIMEKVLAYKRIYPEISEESETVNAK